MVVLPAIDIINGQCVRLRKGDFTTAHVVANDVVDTARGFREAGAEWVHVVDLDGARSGATSNHSFVKNIVETTGLRVELGGGLRDLRALEEAFNLGISRAVIGTAAVTDAEFLVEAVRRYGDKLAVGIDALGSEVRVSGWTAGTGMDYVSFAKRIAEIGVKYIIFTDISHDGMLSGPSLSSYEKLIGAVGCDIIASGGISSYDDLLRLIRIGVYGAIIGKAYYSGNIDIQKAVDLCSR